MSVDSIQVSFDVGEYGQELVALNNAMGERYGKKFLKFLKGAIDQALEQDRCVPAILAIGTACTLEYFAGRKLPKPLFIIFGDVNTYVLAVLQIEMLTDVLVCPTSKEEIH